MINYSDKVNFEVFKRELLLDRFLCKSNKPMSDNYTFDYLELPFNSTIKNSYIFKLAEDMIEQDNEFFKCSIKSIYLGKQDISVFKRNFIHALYRESLARKQKDKFLKSFNEVFNLIVLYDKNKLLDMYVMEDFTGLSDTMTNEGNKENSVAYKFIWDCIGYTFGKIQFNIGSNISTVNKNGVEFLKGIDFTDSDINFLTNVPGKYTIAQLKNDGTTRTEMTKRASFLNTKLFKNKDKVDEFCRSTVVKRMEVINSYPTVKKMIFENELAYIQLIDYDNQFRFNENGSLNNYLKKKIANKDYVLTSKEVIDHKLNNTLYGQLNRADVNRRNNNISRNIKPVLKNADLNKIKEVINSNILFDIISINEIDYISDNIYVYNAVSKFKTEVFGALTKSKIENTKINPVFEEDKFLSKDRQKSDAQRKIELISEQLDIPSEFSEDSKLNAHNIVDMATIMKKLFFEFSQRYFKSETKVACTIKECNAEFIKLCRENNGLTANLDNCYKVLEKIDNEINTIYQAPDYNYSKAECKEANIVCTYFNNLYKAYGYMLKNEFAKTNLIATGIINKANAFLFSDSNAMRVFADSFMATKPDIKQDRYEKREPNPLSLFFSKSDFLYMKELDYRNLEASLRHTPEINPDGLGAQRTWILVYIILNFIARKNSNNLQENELENDDFVNHASMLLNKARQHKWKYDYSDTEKHFSLLYPFVNYNDNPFTEMMGDKGYANSQEHIKELRGYVEQQMKTATDSVKEFVYGENKIYDIFQGMADIAYELSTPMSLYTDFDMAESGESIVGQFLNSCISSLEMQTSMTIYDFLFNYKVPINESEYSINDLNNMLKMFNIVVEASKNDRFHEQLNSRAKLCRHTSDYRALKQTGFYTYNRNWINLHKEMKPHIDKFTGFYLSDEPMLFDIVEYCRHKNVECLPGELENLIQRFNNLREHEWISAFACHKLRNEDKKYANSFQQQFIQNYNLGYLQIQEITKMLELEANNNNHRITYMNPYLENLGNKIIADPTEFNEFKKYHQEMFRRFRVNMVKNESTCVSVINGKMSDAKIYDWMMKMLHTYETIARSFGFASLNGIATLDRFIESLTNSLNGIIKITFDKWKTETSNAMQTRRVQFIAKERYYYIQSIPVMIDWTIKNLEHYLLGNNKVAKADGIDYVKSSKNIKSLDDIMKSFVIKLRAEVSNMSGVQLKNFETRLRKSILSVTDIDKEKAEMLIHDLLQVNNSKSSVENLLNYTMTSMTDKQKKELIDNAKNNINFIA